MSLKTTQVKPKKKEESFDVKKNKDIKKINRLYQIFPLIVFIIMSGLSVGIWYFSKEFIYQNRIKEFQLESNRLHELIVDRLEIYANTLYGVRGFFHASENVTRDEFRLYAEGLQVQENFPGIQGFGYTAWINPNELDAHIKKVRNEGFPEYNVHPTGSRSQYTSIIYIEPFDLRNQQAFGFDMYQEPVRRKAMDTARDTGDAAMSGKVTLVQEIDENVQAGFLIYVPIYQSRTLPETVQERRDQMLGYVYSVFRMDDFMNGVLSLEDIDLSIEVFDVEDIEKANNERRMFLNKSIKDPYFTSVQQANFGGRTWTIRFSANKNYKSNFIDSIAPLLFFIGTFLLGILISFLIRLFITRRNAAVLLAESMTEDLKKRTEENENFRKELQANNVELKKKTQELSKKIKEVEQINAYMVDREMKMIELKKQLEQSSSKKNKRNE